MVFKPMEKELINGSHLVSIESGVRTKCQGNSLFLRFKCDASELSS